MHASRLGMGGGCLAEEDILLVSTYPAQHRSLQEHPSSGIQKALPQRLSNFIDCGEQGMLNRPPKISKFVPERVDVSHQFQTNDSN